VTTSALAERAARAGGQGRALVAAVPIWFWLASLVAFSASIRLQLALADPAPWIFQDEIVYSELAKALAATGAFGMRDVPGLGGFGPVYPAIIAPAFALFEGVPDGYEAVKAVNSVVMSLVAIPTYLLARRLVGPALSFLAAALAVSVPSMVYTSTFMTENAFYPAFMTCALAVVLVLERPTLLRHVLLLASLLVAFLVRAQAASLLPALVTGIGVLALGEAWAGQRRPSLRAFGGALGRFRITWIGLGAGAVLLAGIQVARGQRLTTVLGTYEGVRGFEYSPGAVGRWFLYHLGALDIYVGVLPFAALLLVAALAFRARSPLPELRPFAAGSLAIVFWILISVAAFASTPVGQRIEERNQFHVVPLLLVAAVVWAGLKLPRPWPLAGICVLVAAALPGAVPGQWLLQDTTVHSAPGLLTLLSLNSHLSGIEVSTIVVLGAIAVGVTALVIPGRFAVVVPALVLAYLATANLHAERYTSEASEASLVGGITVAPDWIDRRVGTDADVVELWAGVGVVSFWENEFFNKSIGRVYNLVGQHDSLPQAQLVPDPETGVLRDEHGVAPEADYALVNRWTVIDGRVVERDALLGMTLLEVRGPLVFRERVEGMYSDFWSGPGAAYVRGACEGGTVTVAVTTDRRLFPVGQEIVVSVGGRPVERVRVARGASTQFFSVPLEPENGICGVAFTISPTAVPNDVLGNGDLRELGIRFTSFSYAPPE
jgi:hypothetical protein